MSHQLNTQGHTSPAQGADKDVAPPLPQTHSDTQPRRWRKPAATWCSVWAGLALATTLVSAQAQILIGNTAGFTGPVAAGVKETMDGARLYIDHVNDKGGINGQKIEVIAMDDKFDPKITSENARKLIEEKNVLALFLTRGTPNTEAVIPHLDAGGVPLVGPSTGAMVLYQPFKRHIFNVRSPYQREAEKAVTHLHTMGMTRIAVVHADDSFGADALEGAKKGFGKASMTPVTVIKADRSKPDYARIVPELTKANPQAVIWLGSGNAVAEGVRTLRMAGSIAQVVTLSNNASSGFIKSLGEYSRGVIVTQVFPSERSISTPFVTEALALAKARGLDGVSPAMLEGFAAAKVLVEGLRRAGGQPTRGKLMASLESMRKFDLGGMELSYSREDHSGLNFADLSIIGQDGRFRR